MKQQIEEKLEHLFNKAFEFCLMQVRGEISEESRIELLKVLDKEGKLVIKSSIIKILEQLVEREEKSKKEYLRYIDTYGITNEEVDGWNGKIEDTISYLKSEIEELSTNIDKE